MHNFFGQFNPHIKLDKSFTKTLMIYLLITALSVAGFFWLNVNDNRISDKTKQPVLGVLELSDEDLRQNQVYFLVDDWEFYNGQTLTPEDFKRGEIEAEQYLGSNYAIEYVDDEGVERYYGSATFRLKIMIPEDSRRYALELPEIATSSKIFVNGTLYSELGETDPANYRIGIGSGMAMFEAGSSVEIIVQIADYLDISSGFILPPAFGYADDVSHLINMRFFIHTVMVVVALLMGGVQLLLGIFAKKNRIAIVYALMCFFYVGFTGYTVIYTLFTIEDFPFFRWENNFYSLTMLTIIIIQCHLCKPNKIIARVAIAIAVVYSLFSAAVLHLKNEDFLYAEFVVTVYYELFVVFFINITVLLSLKKLTSKILLGGLLILDSSLIVDNIVTGLEMHYFVPIYTGWFFEISCFILVLTFGVILCVDIINRYRESVFLETRLAGASKLVEMQRAYFPFLTDQINQTKIMRHDLRHNLLLMQSLLSEGDFDKLAEYIANLRGTVDSQAHLTYCDNYVANVIVGHYAGIAAERDVKLTAQIQLDEELRLDDADLCCIFSNLLENAIEACEKVTENRYINVDIHPHGEYLYVNAENSKAGTILRSGERIHTSKPDTKSHGFGLLTIQNIVEKYNGMIDIIHDENTFKIKLAVKVL